MDYQFIDYLESSDDYLHAYDEFAGGQKINKYNLDNSGWKSYRQNKKFYSKHDKYNIHDKPINANGWYCLGGTTACDQFPRGGALWSQKEVKDMLSLYQQGSDIAEIAKVHGRTQGAIQSRLIKNGVLLEDILSRDDDNIKDFFLNSSKKDTAMYMTPNRAIILFTVYQAAEPIEEDDFHWAPSDLCLLTVNGLLKRDGRSYQLTSTGARLVEDFLSLSVSSDPIVANKKTKVLPKTFYLISSEEYQPFETKFDAEEEAKDLESKHIGQKFFVLKAISVHKTGIAPIQSKDLQD